MNTWLIVGCSSGLGKSLAKAVLDHGDQVVYNKMQDNADRNSFVIVLIF